MPHLLRPSRFLFTAALAASLFGCAEEPAPSPKPEASSSAAAAPAASATATASSQAPAPSAEVPVIAHDCPKGTAGEGSLAKPCEAKGNARVMEVSWNGKMDEKGPSFRVQNKSDLVILYGKMVAYFYDKAGKQLEVKDAGSDKTRPNQPCAGNIFSGTMAAGEKAVITFSCVKKAHVPEGTAFIEGEIQTVGFADAKGQKSEYFWRNSDLTPDARPKGGVK